MNDNQECFKKYVQAKAKNNYIKTTAFYRSCAIGTSRAHQDDAVTWRFTFRLRKSDNVQKRTSFPKEIQPLSPEVLKVGNSKPSKKKKILKCQHV